MNQEKCLAIAKLMSRNGSKWTETVRKMAGKLARNTGHHRRSVHLLTRIVNLVNAKTEEGALHQRCQHALEWLENYEAVVLEQYKWSVTSMKLAKAVIALAAADSELSLRRVITRELGPKAYTEACKLARILVYSENVLSFAKQHRTRKYMAAEMEGVESSDAARLRAEPVLYSGLPARFRKRLETFIPTAEAA